jgi:hypothetical protein
VCLQIACKISCPHPCINWWSGGTQKETSGVDAFLLRTRNMNDTSKQITNCPTCSPINDQPRMHANCMQRNKSTNAKIWSTVPHMIEIESVVLKHKTWQSCKFYTNDQLSSCPLIKNNQPPPLCVHVNFTHKIAYHHTPKGTHDHLTELKRMVPT